MELFFPNLKSKWKIIPNLMQTLRTVSEGYFHISWQEIHLNLEYCSTYTVVVASGSYNTGSSDYPKAPGEQYMQKHNLLRADKEALMREMSPPLSICIAKAYYIFKWILKV